MKSINLIHTLVTIGLALFFLYSGTKKFLPKKQSPSNTTEQTKAQNKKQMLIQAIQNNAYKTPETFSLTIKSMSGTGFLKMIGIIQILSGLLMLYPPTRLVGALVLLPIILNIFLLHVFMDNRPDENLETGLLLCINILIVFYYKIRLKDLLILNPAVNN